MILYQKDIRLAEQNNLSTDEALIQCPICNENAPQGYLLCPFCGADLTTIYETKIFPPIGYKEVWGRIGALLTKPRSAFLDISDNPDSKGVTLFIFAIAFGMALQIFALLMHNYFFSWRLPVIFILMWIFSLLLPLFIWLIGSFAIRTAARLLGGKASKKQIRGIVGYGMLPPTLASLFNAILYVIALPWNRTNIYDFTEVFATMTRFRNSFAGILGLIINILGFVVAGVFIVFMLKPASNFSWIEATVSTGLPVILFIALLLTYYFAT